jgi:hypothetical protein
MPRETEGYVYHCYGDDGYLRHTVASVITLRRYDRRPGHWRLLSWRYDPIAGSPQRCSPETLIGLGAGVLDDDLGVSREMLRHRTVLAEKILMLASGLL